MATLLCKLNSAHSFAFYLGKIYLILSLYLHLYFYSFSLAVRNNFLMAFLISLWRDRVLLAYLTSQDHGVLGCDAVKSGRKVRTVRNNVLPQSAGYFKCGARMCIRIFTSFPTTKDRNTMKPAFSGTSSS
jgi:hypothetical protein